MKKKTFKNNQQTMSLTHHKILVSFLRVIAICTLLRITEVLLLPKTRTKSISIPYAPIWLTYYTFLSSCTTFYIRLFSVTKVCSSFLYKDSNISRLFLSFTYKQWWNFFRAGRVVSFKFPFLHVTIHKIIILRS